MECNPIFIGNNKRCLLYFSRSKEQFVTSFQVGLVGREGGLLKIEIELKPFTVPNYVLGEMPLRLRQEGFVEGPKWHLKELDDITLSELCDRFRKDVFAKAGKKDPLA